MNRVHFSSSKEGSHPEQLQLLKSHLIILKNTFMAYYFQNYAGILGLALQSTSHQLINRCMYVQPCMVNTSTLLYIPLKFITVTPTVFL